MSPQLITMLNGLPHRWSYVFHRPDADPIESLDDFRSLLRSTQKSGAELAEPENTEPQLQDAPPLQGDP
jgi:hypothetical protein